MSRRKQSVPCKVGGSDEIPMTDIQSFVPKESSTSYKTDSNPSVSNDNQPIYTSHNHMSPESSKEGISSIYDHSGNEMDLDMHDGSDSKDSLENTTISTELATKEELKAQLSSALPGYKHTNFSEPSKNKQRFSARIRAKVQLKALSLSPPSNGPKPQMKQVQPNLNRDAETINKPQHIASKAELRQRNLSYEEELACPICNKTFMSKYGLLTHTEVHATPELKCTLCNLAFSRRSAFVAHQIHRHGDDYGEEEIFPSYNFTSAQSAKQKSNKIQSGFGDLSIIDFSCSKFPVIAGELCMKTKHQLSDRDRRHFFMCKRCNVLFPTLLVLKKHLETHHPRKNVTKITPTPTPKLTILGKTYIINNEKAIVESLGIGDAKSSAVPECRSFMSALQLRSKTVKDRNDLISPCNYGMDNDTIRTSPLTAFLNVPQWLRNNNTQQNWTASGVVPEEQDRPPLRLKLLRCKSGGLDEQTGDLKTSLRAVESYLINTGATDGAKMHACGGCGQRFQSSKALENHRGGSACGIGVRNSSNGRKMFWCRLCNYASFEKSTIMRHQRTHTGIRPYSCRFCQLAFTTKANCERHVRKRHINQVPNESDVKEAVVCDEELLKKARSCGEFKTYQPKAAPTISPSEQHYGFRCRLCKSVFTTRSNGARHVMDKHHIYSRKGANEMVTYVQPNEIKNQVKAINVQGPVDPTKLQFIKAGIANKQFQGSVGQAKKRRIDDVMGASHVPVKVPRIIPLSKIQAYHESSTKMAEHFRDNYGEVLGAVGISGVKRISDIKRMSSTLVSLLASASSMLLESENDANRSRNSFKNNGVENQFDDLTCDEINEPASWSPPVEQRDQESNLPVSRDASYHELVQLYADGKWTEEEDSKVAENQNFSFPSSTESYTAKKQNDILSNGNQTAQKAIKVELLTTQQPDSSSSTTSPDLASIKRLVDFVHQPGPLMQNGDIGSSPSEIVAANDGSFNMSVDSKGKYRMVALKPKANESSKGSSGLTWKFIPYPPEMRDEKGRYMKDPEKSRQAVTTNGGFSPFLTDGSRPTMVPISNNSVVRATSGGGFKRSHLSDSGSLCLRSRKCPKCDKTFPWASSLRRHIMTHTGLKPFMCAKCSMRFTTRSNLLRHAYRRHGVARGSEDRNQVLITLSRKEQEERATLEAAGEIADLPTEEEEEEVDQHMENDDILSEPEMDEPLPLVVAKDSPKITEIDISNKRFMCGLCSVPFANRSNVVRHLHRLHNITKDDENFRALLVKIDHSNPPQVMDVQQAPAKVVTPKSITPKSPSSVQPETPVTESPKMQQHPVEKKDTETVTSMSASTTPQKVKPFKCTICSIGFTKRNNAARHVQQQHHISRHRANFANLIEKIDSSPERVDSPEPVEQEKAIDVKPDANELANALKEEKSPTPTPIFEEPSPSPPPPAPPVNPTQPPGHVWRSRRMSAKKRLEAGEQPEPLSPPKPLETRHSNKTTQFVCGVCKRIFKQVEELKEHLDDHNIPHPWHCPLCGVPFTNKYNCQRHLSRRHGDNDLEPKYVEDVRHGPRHPRKRSRRTM